MLDAYIIDAIREEELERDRRAQEGRRIWLELPLPSASNELPALPITEPEAERGVIIIPLYDDSDAAA